MVFVKEREKMWLSQFATMLYFCLLHTYTLDPASPPRIPGTSSLPPRIALTNGRSSASQTQNRSLRRFIDFPRGTNSVASGFLIPIKAATVAIIIPPCPVLSVCNQKNPWKAFTIHQPFTFAHLRISAKMTMSVIWVLLRKVMLYIIYKDGIRWREREREREDKINLDHGQAQGDGSKSHG